MISQCMGQRIGLEVVVLKITSCCLLEHITKVIEQKMIQTSKLILKEPRGRKEERKSIPK